MPTMTDQARSVPLNSQTANIWAGQYHEYLGPSGIIIYAVAQAVGIFATVNLGGKIVMQDQAITARAASITPIIPDDRVVKEAFGGGRLYMTYRNATAGNIIVNTLMDITPLA